MWKNTRIIFQAISKIHRRLIIGKVLYCSYESFGLTIR